MEDRSNNAMPMIASLIAFGVYHTIANTMSAYTKAIPLLEESFAWWIQPRKRFFNYCIACFFIRYTKKQGSGIHKTHYELPLKTRPIGAGEMWIPNVGASFHKKLL